MAHHRSHSDMFHVAPPPPHHLAPPHHHHHHYPPPALAPHSPYAPPPTSQYHDRAYPTTPQSQSEHHHASPWPRTPQTPRHYPSTPLLSTQPQPHTPTTPHYSATPHPPVTPIREYYPSPSSHAGPSRTPPQYDRRPPPPPAPQTQYVYRHPSQQQQQQQYPQSAPPRIMQDSHHPQVNMAYYGNGNGHSTGGFQPSLFGMQQQQQQQAGPANANANTAGFQVGAAPTSAPTPTKRTSKSKSPGKRKAKGNANANGNGMSRSALTTGTYVESHPDFTVNGQQQHQHVIHKRSAEDLHGEYGPGPEARSWQPGPSSAPGSSASAGSGPIADYAQRQSQSQGLQYGDYGMAVGGDGYQQQEQQQPPRTSRGDLVSVMQPGPSALEAAANIQQRQPILVRRSQFVGALGKNAAYFDRHRADVSFDRDLREITRSWSTEEFVAQRRLVKVWRRQVGSKVHISFRAIKFEEYQEHKNSVIISCIFDDDRNSCFITSVDAIYMLEAVIGERFSIEEKNRIRRNLEVFKPITCSKSKGSPSLFRTIMGFPEPKPRNIEKDLKVFQWERLYNVIKKITEKYMADYSRFNEVDPAFLYGTGTGAHAGAVPPEYVVEGWNNQPTAGPGQTQMVPQHQQQQQQQQQELQGYQPVMSAPVQPQHQDQGQGQGVGLGVNLDPNAQANVNAGPRAPMPLSIDTAAANQMYFGPGPSSSATTAHSHPIQAQGQAYLSPPHSSHSLPAVFAGPAAAAIAERVSPMLGANLSLDHATASQQLYDLEGGVDNLYVDPSAAQQAGQGQQQGQRDYEGYWPPSHNNNNNNNPQAHSYMPVAPGGTYHMDTFDDDAAGDMYGNMLHKPYDEIDPFGTVAAVTVEDVNVNGSGNGFA